MKSASERLIESFTGKEPAEPAANFLAAPRGLADDLTLISGVGPRLAQLLNEAGIWHFWQLAGFSEADVRTLDTKLPSYKGRAVRDKWIAQAARLAEKQSIAIV